MTIEYKDSKRIVGLSDGVSNGYDVANISYSGKSSSSSSQNTYMLGIGFNEDGTKMYRTGYSPTKAIFQYTLSTAWDISTSSYDNVSFSLPNPIAVPYGIEWNGDGTKFVIGDNSTGDLFQFTLSTAYDISTTNSTPTTYDPSETSKPVAFKFFNNGLNAFLVSQNTDYVYKYTLSTAYDISTMSYATNSLSYTGSYYISGMEINSDGTELYLMDHTGNSLRRYTLSTAYDLSTASLTSSFSTSSQFSANTASALRFSADGTKLYISGYGASDFQYDTGSTASDRTLLTNVQDNSLFVEKDTARRYWGTDKVTTEAVYTSVTGQSTYEKLSGTAQAYSSEKAGVELVSTANDGKAIKIGKWKLAREGTLSGLAYMKVEDGSGNLKATSTGVDVSSITARTSGYEYVTFTLPTAVKVYNGYRVYIEYTTSDGSGNFLAFAEFYNGSTTIPTGFEFTVYNKRDSGGNNPSGGWADDGLPTLLIPDAIFDDVPASNVTSDSITWTMQPTIEDDLTTNNGWVFPTNSSYDSTNDQIDLTIASNSFDVSYIDLQKAVYFGSGNNLDDDKFIIRARITKNNNLSDTSKGSSLLLQVSSALTDSAKSLNPQDAVGIRIDTNRTGGVNYFYVHSTDNGTFWDGESSGIAYDWQTGDLYWEIIGDGTNVTGELFTGSDYSTGSLGKATTSQQSPTGMRYLKFCGFNDPSRTATQFSLQDFIIYNGVSSIN